MSSRSAYLARSAWARVCSRLAPTSAVESAAISVTPDSTGWTLSPRPIRWAACASASTGRLIRRPAHTATVRPRSRSAAPAPRIARTGCPKTPPATGTLIDAVQPNARERLNAVSTGVPSTVGPRSVPSATPRAAATRPGAPASPMRDGLPAPATTR